MTVFACAGCGAPLTAPLDRVALPVHADQRYGHDLLGPLMEPGTYAVNPGPAGPPWRRWADKDVATAEAQGWFAPVPSVPAGPRGAVVIAPGDVRGTVFIPERLDGYCCGLDGREGPNLACARCGAAVATRVDDCSYWQAVWLHPRAVRRVGGDAGPRTVLGWDAWCAQRPGLAPVEPAGWWSPVWSAAVAAALARLLAVSGGVRVTVPDGPVADAFRRSVDMLLPPGPAARTLGVAGPGLPTGDADIVLVPLHPQTGESRPAAGAADRVPLAFDVWRYLAAHRDRGPIPGPDPLRDDPLPPGPVGPFRPDRAVFLSTLARLPEVRRPWLRAIHDRVLELPWSDPF